MKLKNFFILLFACLFLNGCGGALKLQKKQSELVSETVWAANDNAKIGRFDQTSKYLSQAVRLIPPPKFRVGVVPFREAARPNANPAIKKNIFSGFNLSKKHQENIKIDVEGKYLQFPDTGINPEKNVVVLPPEFKNAEVVVEDSPQYQAILSRNSDLEKEVAKEKIARLKSDAKVDEIQREKEKIIEKAAEKEVVENSKFWTKVKNWGEILGIVVLLGVGGWALIAFAPAAIPVIGSVFGIIGRLIAGFFRAIFGLFSKK